MAKKKTKRKTTKKKTTKKKTAKKKKGGAFGGMKIKPDAALAKIIGSTPVAPSAMTKKLWQYIKKKKLLKK